MIFITATDLSTMLPDARLNQLTKGNHVLIDNAEEVAIACISAGIGSRYDIANILANPTAFPEVRRWVLCLVVYYLYDRASDDETPQKVIDNYNEALGRIRAIEDGKTNTLLPLLPTIPNSKLRWGSDIPRTH